MKKEATWLQNCHRIELNGMLVIPVIVCLRMLSAGPSLAGRVEL